MINIVSLLIDNDNILRNELDVLDFPLICFGQINVAKKEFKVEHHNV